MVAEVSADASVSEFERDSMLQQEVSSASLAAAQTSTLIPWKEDSKVASSVSELFSLALMLFLACFLS